MFDATQYAGTRMGLYEKYADSVRLDHPDVADVRKTTYAKGVITDFKKIEDDPIQVEPMVKVKGDWGESDYIPILCRPKAEYWDDPEGKKALDFDPTKGFYAGSWQSFRVDDEVIALLQEGIPVAVLGFADGLPRIGEDVVKMTTKSIHAFWDFPDDEHPDWPSRIGSNWPDVFFRMNKVDFHDDAEKGPDGFDLRLLLEAERHDGPEETTYNGVVHVEIDPGAPYGTSHEDEGGGWGDPLTYAFYSEGGSSNFTKVAVWTIIVGPIVYAIYGKFRESYSWSDTYYRFDYDETYTTHHYYQKIHSYGITRLCVKAGIYKEGIIDKIAASINNYPDWNYLGGLTAPNWWPVEVEGMVFQTDLTELFSYLPQFDVRSFDEVQWFVRPHTKAEQQEAGMWPAGKGE